jgi:hypothetical protein
MAMEPDLVPIHSDAASADALLEALADLAVQLPGESDQPQAGSLWQDEDFQRRYRTLQIERLGVAALAQRMADDERLQAAVSCRLDALCRDLAALAVMSLAYFALPDPDPLLIDNEGPIGHHLALPIMRAIAGYFEPDGFLPGNQAEDADEGYRAGGGYHYRNVIAEKIFGDDQIHTEGH